MWSEAEAREMPMRRASWVVVAEWREGAEYGGSGAAQEVGEGVGVCEVVGGRSAQG